MFKINHIHLKAHGPKTTAQWYVDMFGAKIVGQGPGLGGSETVRLDIDSVRINVTNAAVGEALPEGTSDSHYGLEHIGLDIDCTIAHIERKGVEILLPITVAGSGNKIDHIKGPHNVRIELVQPL